MVVDQDHAVPSTVFNSIHCQNKFDAICIKSTKVLWIKEVIARCKWEKGSGLTSSWTWWINEKALISISKHMYTNAKIIHDRLEGPLNVLLGLVYQNKTKS